MKLSSGYGLSGLHQGLQETANTVLGHREGFLVGFALRDASRKGRDRHHVATFLGGLEMNGIGISVHDPMIAAWAAWSPRLSSLWGLKVSLRALGTCRRRQPTRRSLLDNRERGGKAPRQAFALAIPADNQAFPVGNGVPFAGNERRRVHVKATGAGNGSRSA